MEPFVLELNRRTGDAKKTRKEGFTPAVVYGRGQNTVPVKAKSADIRVFLKKFGERTSIKVKLDQEVKAAIIKAVDRYPLSGEILHVDFQLAEASDVVNWEIPLVFTNKEELELKRLSLNINYSQVEVTGRVQDIPDSIEINVGDREYNDLIRISDLPVNPGLKFKMPAETILAVIKK